MRPLSNSVPKGLMPLFATVEGKPVLVPIVDLIINGLAEAGATDFCAVLGNGGRGDILKDHLLRSDRKIAFVKQEVPKGFGDAVLHAEKFVGTSPTFIHADDVFSTDGYKLMSRLYKEKGAEGVLLLRRVANPSKYGIVTVEEDGEFEGHRIMIIKDAEEKPKEPKSDIAISAAYLLSHRIFEGIRNSQPSARGELELTAGIQYMIEHGAKILGVFIDDHHWLNVGEPDRYLAALAASGRAHLPEEAIAKVLKELGAKR
jgi:dTDP-glucose pyrophosphorylase